MPKNPGCWANVLNDCAGALTGEHPLSVAVWAATPGEPDNRASRLRRSITMIDHGQSITKTVRRMTRDILCDHHNNSTNDLDTEGGRFARALEQLFIVDGQRRGVMHPNAPLLRWATKGFPVDGPLLERWFMKTVINHTFGGPLPIGGDVAVPGWPTPELVEMVFGRRPVDRAAGTGIYMVASVGDDVDIGERFELRPYVRANQYIAGCFVSFRNLLFGVNFERGRVTGENLDRFLGRKGTHVVQPVKAINFDVTSVEVQVSW